MNNSLPDAASATALNSPVVPQHVLNSRRQVNGNSARVAQSCCFSLWQGGPHGVSTAAFEPEVATGLEWCKQGRKAGLWKCSRDDRAKPTSDLAFAGLLDCTHAVPCMKGRFGSLKKLAIVCNDSKQLDLSNAATT